MDQEGNLPAQHLVLPAVPQVDLFAQSLVFIPVHLGMHWCLAVIDIPRKAIDYYDSMGGNNKRSGCN